MKKKSVFELILNWLLTIGMAGAIGIINTGFAFAYISETEKVISEALNTVLHIMCKSSILFMALSVIGIIFLLVYDYIKTNVIKH